MCRVEKIAILTFLSKHCKNKLSNFSLVVEITAIVFFCSDGGYFKAHLTFPEDYPQKPPKMKFISDIWHPNGMVSFAFSKVVY